MSSLSGDITYEIKDEIGILTFNRPEAPGYAGNP